MLFEDKIPYQHKTAFIAKLRHIASLLGVPVSWLMVVINFETAGTFSPSIKNKYSGATGLIQFMPNTAVDLGTTVEELATMNLVEQLEYVEKYLVRTQKQRGAFKYLVDLYLAVFYPAAIGRDLDYAFPRWVYGQNSGFDNNRDGQITKGEIQDRLLRDVPASFQSTFKKKA